MNDAFRPVNDKSLRDINAANRDMWDAGKPNSTPDAKKEAYPGAGKLARHMNVHAITHGGHAAEHHPLGLANAPKEVAAIKAGKRNPYLPSKIAKSIRHMNDEEDGEMDLPSKEIGKRAGKRAEKIAQDAKGIRAIIKRRENPQRGFKFMGYGAGSGAVKKKQKDESDPELSTPSTEVGAKDAKKIHGPLSAMQTIAAKNEELHSSLRPGRKPGESTIRQKVMSRPRSETPGWMGKSEREASAHLRRQKDATMEQIQHRARIKRIVKTHDPGGTHTAKFDRCVEEVKGSGKNAYAICMSSIGKNEALK